MTASVFTKEYERFRRLLQKCRVDKGLTQEQVAVQLGKPQSFVSKYESGERRLDIIEFLEVAKALDIEPASFLKRFQGKE